MTEDQSEGQAGRKMLDTAVFCIGVVLVSFTTPGLLWMAAKGDYARWQDAYLVFCAIAPALLMLDATRRRLPARRKDRP